MRCSRWWGPCLALLVLAPLAPAQDTSPLDVLPVQCPIVIQMRGFERTKGRLITLINNALPDLGKRVQETIEDTLKSQLGERQLKGLAPFGPVVIFFTEVPQANQEIPPAGVMVRVTDAAAFRTGFFTEQERKTLKKRDDGVETIEVQGTTLHVLERHGYLIVTPHAGVPIHFVKGDKSLRNHFTADAAKRMQEADVGVYVHAAAIYQTYGQTIRDGRQFIDFMLAQGGGGLDKAQLEMFRNIINGALQGFEDSRHLLVTADLRPDGLALRAGVTFGQESKTNQFLKSMSPGDLKAVESLPSGQLSYVASRSEPALSKALNAFTMGIFADPNTENGKAIEKAMLILEEAGGQETMNSANLQSHGIAVHRFTDSAKAVQGQLQLFQAIAAGKKYSSMQLKKAAVKPDAHAHRGFTLHHAEMVWDFEQMAANLPIDGAKLAEAMKKIMGEGINVWFGTDGKNLVQLTAKDWPQAQKILDDYLDAKSVVGKDPSFQEARKNLPGQANLIAYYDVPQALESIRMGMAATLGALGQGGPKFEPAKEKAKPIFFGVALILKPEHAGIDLWVPAAAAREVQKMVESLMGAFGG